MSDEKLEDSTEEVSQTPLETPLVKVLSFEEEKARLRQELEQGITNASLTVDTSSFDDEGQLKEMNENHAFINSYGGRPMVLCYTYNNVSQRKEIEFRTPDSIAIQYSNQSIKVDKTYVQLGRWWIQHAGRREYESVIFDPSVGKEHNNCFNIYQGLSVEPKKGSWSNTLRHIYRVLCNSDREKFYYTIKWFAWCLQNPGRPAEVVVIFKGKQGAGKGFIFSQFVKIYGNHGIHISNRKHLTGDFNGHLGTCVFLFADEAYYPGDKEVEGALNQLISEDRIAMEKKRVDVIMTKNCLHIGMATNSEWVIPATGDARRYYINKSEDTYAFSEKSPEERKIYFDNLWGEMNDGGREAMAFDLLNMKLGDWHPRFSVPYTEEFRKQASISLTGISKIVASFLEDGEFPGSSCPDGLTYSSSYKTIDKYIKDNVSKLYERQTTKSKSDCFTKLGATKLHDKSGNLWIFPRLQVCKVNFIKHVSKHYEFDTMDDDWSTGRTDI